VDNITTPAIPSWLFSVICHSYVVMSRVHNIVGEGKKRGSSVYATSTLISSDLHIPVVLLG